MWAKSVGMKATGIYLWSLITHLDWRETYNCLSFKMCKSHNRRILATSPWMWVNSWQTWIISVQTQTSRSAIVQWFIRAISLTPGVGSPFSLFCLIKIYEVLMLPSSPPHLRELFLLYANYESHKKGRNYFCHTSVLLRVLVPWSQL